VVQPSAEVTLTVEDVDALLAAQHPHLRGPLRLVANGWDNEVFRLGDHLAVRLPRREVAAELIENEQRWLPELAPHLPVPVPTAVALGVPSRDYPWHWSVVPWFEGISAADAPDQVRDGFAPQVADFLSALHVASPVEAPHNPVRGVPLRVRDDAVRERVAGMPALQAIWEDALAAPEWTRPPVWVHGDVHVGNLVVNECGALSAVIDFGDLCGGDPACDLAIAWTGFTAAGRAAFRARLGARYDEATWRRARGWAVAMATLVRGDPALRAMSAHALTQLAGD